MVLPIKFRIRAKNIALFLMWWYMLITPFLVYWTNLPRVILYLGDALGIVLFLFVFRDVVVYRKKTFVNKETNFAIVLFVVFGTMSAIWNFVNPICYAWGIRNCFRFFVFFWAASLYLTVDDFLKTRPLIKLIFWVSLPLCVYEAYFIEYPPDTIIGDMVGGIYHGFSGVTGPLNVILVLVVADVLNDYLSGKKNFILMFLTMLAAVYMSGLAELKVFIVELVVIVIVNMLHAKKSLKSILVVILCVVSLSYIITFFTAVNGDGRVSYGEIFTWEGFIEYISKDSGYSEVGDLNRFGGIGTLNEDVFRHDTLQHIFGIGIGGGEYTNFFESAFYQKYNHLHYQWFHMIWTYIENGYIGIITLMAFVVLQYRAARKYIKDSWVKNFVCTVMVLFPFLFAYNISLRSEVVGFYLYFIMALPCICKKESFYQKQLELRRLGNDT